MIPYTITGLLNNIALLICLVFLYDLLTIRQVEDKTVAGQIITGMILGIMGLSVMLNPWEFAQGVVFDTRSILLCITGFFFGTVPVIITILMTAGYRLYLGGGGLWMGVAVILTSGFVGLAWRYRLKEDWNHVSWKQIYLMGVVVHVFMLFWTILLPSHVVKNVFSSIFLPVLFLYPAGTALLGQFMINRHSNKLAKKELIKSEERFNLAMNASKDGLWDWDITTDKVYYSPAYGEMLGYAYSEIPQQVAFWKGLMHPDDRDISLKANLGCIENQCDNFNIEFRLKMKNGGWKWINSRGKVVGREDTGRATRMVGTHVDISEYKSNMEILRASEEKFRLAFYTSPDAINLNRLQDGVYIDINNSFTQMVGYTREEVIGKTAIGLNLWKNPHDRQKLIDGLQKNGYVENLEAQFVAKDGAIKDGLMCSRLLKINEESIFISITRDITDRKRVENEIKQAAENLKAVFNSTPNVLALVNEEVKVEMLNHKGEAFTGRNKDKFMGTLCGDVFNCINSFDNGGCGKNPECSKCLLRALSLSTFKTGEPHLEKECQMTFLLDGNKKNIDFLISTTLLEINGAKVLLSLTDITEHKKAENDLRKGDEQHRLILQTAIDGFWLTDVNGKILEANESYCRMSGYKREELLTMNIQDLEAKEKDMDVMARMERLIAIGQDRFETQHRRKDGTIFDVEASVQYKQNADGCICFLRDITNRKTSEKSLKDSEQKWRNVLVNTPQIGISLDPDANIIFANGHFLKLTGWKESEVIGRNWFDRFIPKQNREIIREVFKTVMHQRDTLEFSTHENEIVTRSGELRNIAWSNVLTKDISGDIADITCLGIDLTERKLVEKELSFQAMLLNQISDHITATDLEGNIIYVNEAVTKSLKQNQEELLGKMVTGYGEDSSRGVTQEQIINSTLRDGEWTGEIVNYDSDGKEMIMNCRTKLVKDNNGNPISMVGIATDITEYKKMETRVQQAQKMESIGNLAGGIAHDFNNILYPIIGLSEMLIEDLPKNSLENENVKEILKAGQRGSELVKQILAFSRQNEHTMTPVRVQFVMKEVLKLIRASIPMNIEINQHLQSDCGLVLADSTQLHQIGMNLITNAYHAVEGVGGKIDVQVREIIIEPESIDLSLPPGKYAMLSVSDNGGGIDPANKDKIFEPYFTTKEQGKGTGLGLSVVYGIVKEHQGEIKVYSEVGKGTTFNIYLPLMAKSDMVESNSEKVAVEGGSEHILLVDDEPAISSLEKKILERLGYTVSERTSSFDALEAFRANPDRYDLVISDMSMPHMTGEDLAREMLSIRPNLPIIICTGFSERMNEDLAREIGIKGFLMKPVTISALTNEVRKVLDETKGFTHE